MNCVSDEFPTSSLKYEVLSCYNLLRSKYISDNFIFEQLIYSLLQERDQFHSLNKMANYIV